MFRTTRIITSLLLVLALVATACAEESATPGDAMPGVAATGDAGTNPEIVTIDIQGFLFQDGEIEIPIGTTVRWVNQDRILHTVTAGTPDAPTGEFDLQLADAGAAAEFTFDTTGVFDYFCSRHPHMTGTITVTP